MCLVTVAALCLFDPSGAFVSGDMISPSFASNSNEYAWCGHSGRKCYGPVGELRVGMRVQMTESWTLDYGIVHRSFIMENDRGTESFTMGLTWKPFSR